MMYCWKLVVSGVMIVADEMNVAQDYQRPLSHFQLKMLAVEDGVTRADERVAVLAVKELEEKRGVIRRRVGEAILFDGVQRIKKRVAQVGFGEPGDADELHGHVARLRRRRRAFLMPGMEQLA